MTLIAGCGAVQIKSRWRTADDVIDGKSTGWFFSATAIDDSRASVVALNDEEYLYIGLTTTDRDLQRLVIHDGVAVWFDRDGGSKKTFGIRPVALERPMRPMEEGREAGFKITDPSHEPSATGFDELEVYTSGEDQPQRMATLAAGGVYMRYHRSRDTLFYEVRVPLAESGAHPFAISAKPGATLGVGLETSMSRTTQRFTGEGEEGGTRPEGGIGGRRGGGMGRGREGRPRDRLEGSARPDPFEIWCKLELAQNM
jgi:hypothetical protein